MCSGSRLSEERPIVYLVCLAHFVYFVFPVNRNTAELQHRNTFSRRITAKP
jgi:hypothetical protein